MRAVTPSAAAPMTRVEKRFAGDDVFTKQIRMETMELRGSHPACKARLGASRELRQAG